MHATPSQEENCHNLLFVVIPTLRFQSGEQCQQRLMPDAEAPYLSLPRMC